MSFDNPVLRRESLCFSRQWIGWLLVLGVAWAGLTWLLRRWVPMQYFGMQPWQTVVLDTMQMVLRADVPIALFIAYRCASDAHWHGMREEFALRFLTAREILFGKIAVPVAVLALMNVFGVYLNYHEVLVDPAYDVTVPVPWMQDEPPSAATEPETPELVDASPYTATLVDPWDAGSSETFVVTPFAAPARPPAPRGIVVSAGWPVTIFGLVEDFLYSAVMMLVAMGQFLFRRDPLAASMQALWRIALVGAFIAAAGWFWYVLSIAMPYRTSLLVGNSIATEFLVSNAVWFLLVLPFEAGVLVFFWRRTVRRMEEWLQAAE